MDALRTSRSGDVWIEESNRPYNLSVQELVQAGGLRKYSINVYQVEECIARLMLAIEAFEPDTVLTAASILFIMVVRKFQVRLGSVLQFAENFLVGGDPKPHCAALQMMLRDDYEHHVTRYEKVKLTKAVNATAVLNQQQQ